MNTYVNFEIAKLLKEKGFDKECSHHYEYALTSQKDVEQGHTGAFGWKKGECNLQSEFFINNYKGIDLSNKSWYLCSAPTIADVVMWLYEKHGIWICVYTMDKWMSNGNDREQLFDYGIKQMKLGLIDIPKKPEEFNSPTEAYQEAIKYCLNELNK